MLPQVAAVEDVEDFIVISDDDNPPDSQEVCQFGERVLEESDEVEHSNQKPQEDGDGGMISTGAGGENEGSEASYLRLLPEEGKAEEKRFILL